MATKRARDWFSRPQDDRRVKTAWEHFLGGSGEASDALRCLIDDSWRRCLSGQVDPLRPRAAPPIEGDRLTTLRKRHERLVSASTPLMAQAREILSHTGTVMILTDPVGTILDLEGDPRMRQPLEDVRLIPGCNWTESAVGTNAIGTALALGQPVQIHASEHFCEGIQQWTCSATIIRDPVDSSILGAIDVSGLSRSYSRHSLALVVTTADRIESRLAKLEMERRFRLLDHCVGILSASHPEGVLLFDRRGYLLKANDKAEAALAALGAPFEITPSAHIPALAAEVDPRHRLAIPEWVRPDWIRPILDGKDLLGTALSIPMAHRRVIAAQRASNDTAAPVAGFERVVGTSAVLLEALLKAKHLARSHVPVLLLGETGVGKELFARGIHDAGANRERPFVALNCGGLSRELMTSELFGYAEGAFTGARRGGAIGKIEAANGGTLFLDEIGEMPLDLQPHFLRVLEEGEIYRVGENSPRKVSFRLIAATHRELRNEVSEGRFRMDLYYRIAVTSIRIPALRDRREDIPAIVENMLRMLAERHKMAVPEVEVGVMRRLQDHLWPGNVRELRNVMEGMILMADGGRITEADLPPELHIPTAVEPPPANVAAGTLEGAEQEQIRTVIAISRGNLTLAAKRLGIAKSTLYLKLRKFDMQHLASEHRSSGL